MSTFNNRSTQALNIHKRFSTLELTNGSECQSTEWGRSVDGKIKGGVLVLGTLLANTMTNSGNTTVEGNLAVTGVINGNLIGDYIVEEYDFEGTYDGNVKGCYDVLGNLTVIQKLEIPNPGIITDYLGNCITDTDASAFACANNNDTITFKTDGNVVATMNTNASWQTGKGSATGDFAYAEGGTAVGEFAHSQGTATIAEDHTHVEGGNNISEVHGPMFITGYGNRTTVGSGASIPPFIDEHMGHVEGINNSFESDTTFVHIEGESSNIAIADSVFVSGFGHQSTDCTGVHIEGFRNTAVKLSESHIEGRLNVVGNISATASTALHVEGENHSVGHLSVGHIEGASCTVNYPAVGDLTNSWAGGHSAKINQSYEWVRSAGKINVTGDAQTGIYTLYRTQFDGTPRALGVTDTTPTGTATGITVQDHSCHIYEFNVAGRTNNDANDYYACNLLVVAKRDSGVYTIDTHKLTEHTRGHFVGKPNLVSVGTASVDAGTFSLLMDADPGAGQEIYWAATAISTQVM